MESSPQYTLVVLGAPGVGKSTFLNYLCDGKDSGRFKASGTCKSGETQLITSHECKAINTNIRIRVFDLPGIGDIELKPTELARQFQETLEGKNIDMALLFTKAQDYRLSIQEVMALKFIQSFFDNLKPDAVFIVVTHCDQVENLSQQAIQEKLNSFDQKLQLKLSSQNVVCFKKSTENLSEFIKKFVKGKMTGRDVISAFEDFHNKLSQAIDFLDSQEKTKKLQNELMEIKEILRENEKQHQKQLKEQEEILQKKIDELRKEKKELEELKEEEEKLFRIQQQRAYALMFLQRMYWMFKSRSSTSEENNDSDQHQQQDNNKESDEHDNDSDYELHFRHFICQIF